MVEDVAAQAHRSSSVIHRAKLLSTCLGPISKKTYTRQPRKTWSLNLCRLLDRRGVQLRFRSVPPPYRSAVPCQNGYSLCLITGLRRIGLSSASTAYHSVIYSAPPISSLKRLNHRLLNKQCVTRS